MITLYTTGCPRCKVLHQKLSDKGLSFTIFDDVDAMIEMGFMEAPVLEVNGKQMNFSEAVAWLNNLK